MARGAIVPLDTPEAREIARAYTAGSTTDADEVGVLWIGRFYCLIKRPAGSLGRGEYISPSVVLFRHTGGGPLRSFGEKVHDCNMRRDGILTPERLRALILVATQRDNTIEAEDAAQAEAARRQSVAASLLHNWNEHEQTLVRGLRDAAAAGDDEALLGLAAAYRVHLTVKPDPAPAPTGA